MTFGEAITDVCHELAAKHGFIPMYEAIDRHGALEWLYRQDGEPSGLHRYVGLAAWATEAQTTLESTAGLATSNGFSRQTVRRVSAASDHRSSEEWDFVAGVMNPAFDRTFVMYQHAVDRQAVGEIATEQPFVVPRSTLPDVV